MRVFRRAGGGEESVERGATRVAVPILTVGMTSSASSNCPGFSDGFLEECILWYLKENSRMEASEMGFVCDRRALVDASSISRAGSSD